jgi:hypothetical protein
MGSVPTKSEWTGCLSIVMKIRGYMEYRAMVREIKKMKRRMSRTRKAHPIALKTLCVDFQGIRKRRLLHIPVPI